MRPQLCGLGRIFLLLTATIELRRPPRVVRQRLRPMYSMAAAYCEVLPTLPLKVLTVLLHVDERGRRAWNELFPGEPMPEGSLLQAIRARGYTSLRTSSGEEVAIFDPANIRSRFAAFDPARSNSRDLLAGIGVGGVIGAGVANQNQRPRT